jgi:protein associated with RNAse G/E
VVNDESLAITSEEDVKISSDYTYEHLDYGEYYNRDTQQYENDLCTKYNSTVDSYRGEDTYLDTLPWNPVSDFQ